MVVSRQYSESAGTNNIATKYSESVDTNNLEIPNFEMSGVGTIEDPDLQDEGELFDEINYRNLRQFEGTDFGQNSGLGCIERQNIYRCLTTENIHPLNADKPTTSKNQPPLPQVTNTQETEKAILRSSSRHVQRALNKPVVKIEKVEERQPEDIIQSFHVNIKNR